MIRLEIEGEFRIEPQPNKDYKFIEIDNLLDIKEGEEIFKDLLGLNLSCEECEDYITEDEKVYCKSCYNKAEEDYDKIVDEFNDLSDNVTKLKKQIFDLEHENNQLKMKLEDKSCGVNCTCNK